MSKIKTHNKLLGWNIGGTNSSAVIGTSKGEIITRQQWPSHTSNGPEVMMDEFLTHAQYMIQENGDIDAVGVSIGGPLNTLSGVIKSPPHLPGWDNIPLADRLKNLLKVPVIVEHDAAACLEAEWLWGSAQNLTHVIYLTCGTGCGAGIMLDNRIVRGPEGQTPEVGHIRLDSKGPKLFGKVGCVESFCSGQGIKQLAAFMYPDKFGDNTDTKTLAELAKNGDDSAQAVLRESAKHIGQLCALLVDIFSPQLIILGSLARYLEEWWLETIRNELMQEALPINATSVKITTAKLKDKLQDLSSIAPCIFNTMKSAWRR